MINAFAPCLKRYLNSFYEIVKRYLLDRKQMTPLLFVTAPELGGKSEDWNPLSKTQKSEMLI